MDSRRGFVGKLFTGILALNFSKRRTEMSQAGKTVNVDVGKPIMTNRMRVFVTPATAHVGSLALESVVDEIKINNNTGGDIRVWFPQGQKLFNERSVSDWSSPFLIPNGQDRILRVKVDPEEGTYTYHIYSDTIENFADGNSPPNMSCP